MEARFILLTTRIPIEADSDEQWPEPPQQVARTVHRKTWKFSLPVFRNAFFRALRQLS